MSRITGALRAPTAQRALWTLVSQGLSSITNFVTSLVVAKTCTPDEFGAFALAFSFYGLGNGFTRSIAALPFAVRPGVDVEHSRRRGAAAATTALVLGGTIGVAYALGGVLFGGHYRDALVAVGAFLSLMCVQETWRTVFIAEQRPRVAAGLDLLWLLLEVPTFAFVLGQGLENAWTMAIAWALPGALAGVAGWLLWRRVAGLRASLEYVRADRDIWSFQALEYISVMGANQLALLAVAGIGAATHVGALRGAATLTAPLTILIQGVGSFVLAEITRRGLNEAGTATRWADGLSVFLGGVAVVWVGVLLVVPDGLGRGMLGDTWPYTAAVLLPIGLQFLGQALAQGQMVLMFSRADSRAVFQVSAVTAALILLLVVSGEAMFGLEGAAWGYAAANLGTVPLWFWRARRPARTVSASPAVDPLDGTVV